MLVAVYGTLRNGGGNHYRLANAKYITNFRIEGFSMYNIGQFPGIKAGKSTIFVELYEINETILKSLDQLEGFITPNNPRNFYNREEITRNGYTFFIYTYKPLVYEADLIETGDWFDVVYS